METTTTKPPRRMRPPATPIDFSAVEARLADRLANDQNCRAAAFWNLMQAA